MGPRRFPPLLFRRRSGECFIVRDDNGQALSYVYFDDDRHRRVVNKRLTTDEAAHGR